jgi:hypothetical protein
MSFVSGAMLLCVTSGYNQFWQSLSFNVKRRDESFPSPFGREDLRILREFPVKGGSFSAMIV